MASPRKSFASQVEFGATNAQQMRFESSSEDDDDEDEHKLQIDLSSVEDDTFSLESHEHEGVAPTKTGDSPLASSEPPPPRADPSNSDPLQSLQMLVRSPYAKVQISSAVDASRAKGCESICGGNVVSTTSSSNVPILSSSQQPSPTASSSSSSIQRYSAISVIGVPPPVSSAPLSNVAPKFTCVPPGAADCDSRLTAAKTTDNDSVAEEEEAEAEAEAEEEEEEEAEEEIEGDGDEEEYEEEDAKRVSVATIQRVLKKLNAAAIDEINLRTLQELPSEEAFSFNRFRKMLSNHSPQFDALPNLSTMVGGGGHAAATFPPHQNLSALMRQELQSSFSAFPAAVVRNPPALTVISNLDVPVVASRPGRRRSPPPMVPIANFRCCTTGNNSGASASIHDVFGAAYAQRTPFGTTNDCVIDRLRRLGTDVAVEPRSPPQFPLMDEDNDECDDDDDGDDDEPPFMPPECILSTEPAVTKASPLPSLMPIPGDQARNVNLNRVQPPPPSLIPINRATPSKWPTARFVPILPRDATAGWHINVNQAPLTLAPSNGGACATTAFLRPTSSSLGANPKLSFCGATSVIKRPKKPFRPSKSHFTKLANSLVLPANATKRLDPVLLAESVLAEAMKPESSARLGELEIIKVSPSSSYVADEAKMAQRPPTPPRLTFTATTSTSSSTFTQPPDVALLAAPAAPAASLPPPPTVATTPAPVASGTKSNFFEFSLKKFANSTVLTKSQRKLYGCCVCSSVYHKMFSLKKHFYRTHVNPFCITRQDALKYDVAVPQNSYAAGRRPTPNEMYKCDTCGVLLSDHEKLRRHVGEHQPSNYEHANRYRCSGCNFVFRKEKVFTRHLLECASAAASAAPAAAIATRPVDEAAAPGSTAPAPFSVVDPVDVDVAQSLVPSNCDDVAAGASSAAVGAAAQPPKSGAHEKTDEALVITGTANMMCLFCEVTFKDNTERQKHVLQNHHPKRKQQPCAYCKKKDINDLRELLQHICEAHNKKYFGCAKCKIRFKTKDELTAHRQESHIFDKAGTEKIASAVEKPKPAAASVKTKNGRTFRCSKCLKLCKGMTELLSHRKTAHYQPKDKIKQHVYDGPGDTLVTRAKQAPYSTDGWETEFYRSICQNVKTNLECYVDGKLDQKDAPESKCVTRSSLNNNNFGCGSSEGDVVQASNGELGFVEMYGRENFNAAFLRNVSRLHIGTQLTMLKKTNALNQSGGCEAQPVAGGVSVPSKLSLTPQKLNAATVSEEGTKDVNTNSTKEIEFSGEWIRPRRYICKVCLARFNGFWEIEDHFWAKHPNVWHSFYEFPAEQDPGAEFLQTCKRFLSNAGICGKADTKWSTSTPSSQCTKCGLVITPTAEFHKHILECGGDTNWMATMYTPTKKHKKWRPYSGHRRRRTVTKNRMFLRNIPETPMKLPSQSKGKQKAGDSETIQKMIANLPPKRITRRVVNFDDVNRSRYVARTSVLTRRRREQLDSKASARIAKAFTVDNVDVMSIVRRKRQGSKPTFKEPLSTKNHQQSPKPLPTVSDPVTQPIVQVEAIKIEKNSELMSVEALVHAVSTPTDYEKSTTKETEQIDNKEEVIENVNSKNADVSTVQIAAENSSNIADEKLPVEVAPSIATAVDAFEISEHISKVDDDDSKVEPPVQVDVAAESLDVAVSVSFTDTCVTAPSVETSDINSVTKILEATVSDSVCVEAPLCAAATATVVSFVDESLKETFSTECEVEANALETLIPEEKITEVSNIENASNHISSDMVPIENCVAPTTSCIDEAVHPIENDISAAAVESPQPAGCQSPALPDSSVILAAMADTFRQTDIVTSNNVYSGGRKRKRGSKQPKCKKCSSKSSRKPQIPCVACSEQKQQKEAELSASPQRKQSISGQFLQFICDNCGSEVFSTAREGKICNLCLQKMAEAKVENAEELPAAPLPTASLSRTCSNCGCVFSSNLVDIHICDKCASLKACSVCGDEFDSQNDATICTKCSLAASAAAASPKAQAMVTTASTTVRVTTPEKVTETKSPVCRLCGEPLFNLSSNLCTHCQPMTPKQSYLVEGSVTPTSSCRSQCDIPETITTPKSELEASSLLPSHLRTPSPKKSVENDQCIHCNEKTNDRNDTGNPACRMCHELWITLNTDSLEPAPSSSMDIGCIECHILRTSEATSHRYCEGCMTKNVSPISTATVTDPPSNNSIIKRRRSSEVSVQVGESSGLADLYPRATKMPVLTPSLSSIPPTTVVKPSEDVNNKATATGAKNTLLLICNGCYGTYNLVSAYKEHRQQCPFRNSDDEASKKPLLGFAKRIKSGVEIVQVDSGAGSFEIGGGVLQQMHDETISASTGNVLLKTESCDIGGQSTSGSDLDTSAVSKRFKPKIATEESIEETINSVIEMFCSTSTPIVKKEDNNDCRVLAEPGPEISNITNDSSVLASPVLSISDEKKVTKRLRNKPVDSPTRVRNMKVVEGQVEKLLQSTKSKKVAARKVFSFSDLSDITNAKNVKEESTTNSTAPVEDRTKKHDFPSKCGSLPEALISDAVSTISEPDDSGSPFKKNLRSTKLKLTGKTRAQQKASSSNNASAPESCSVVAEEECASGSQSIANVSKESTRSGGKKMARKRTAEDEVLDQSSSVRLSTRLRRKSVLTEDVAASRVLRSKFRGDVGEESKGDISVAPVKVEEDAVKAKKSEIAAQPKSESHPKESTSAERRRNPSADKGKGKAVVANVVTPEPVASAASSGDAETNVKPPKSKSSAKRKADAKDGSVAASAKRVRSASHDLGFSVAKTGKNVRCNVRVKDEDAAADVKTDDENQLANLSAADGVTGTSTDEPPSEQAEITSTPSTHASERGNFLELGPSVPHSYLQVSSIGERPVSAEGLKVRRTVAEEESMANHSRDQSNDLEQQHQHQLRFIESLSDSNFKDAAEMQRIQQNLERSFSYVISMLNAVCEVLGSPDVSSANSLDPSVAEELEELKKYADVASEAVYMLKNAKTEDSSFDFSHDFSSVIFETDEPPKLYCELESQTKNSKDFVIHKSANENKSQNNVNKISNTSTVNGIKSTTVVKNGKIKSNKNQSNGVKRKLRCNHCQKVLPTKNEMAAHIQGHFRRFTTSKKDNAAMLKMCIADGFEQLLKDKAIESFLKYSHVAERGLCAPLKMLTQSRESQLEKWKSVVTKLVEIENEAGVIPNGTASSEETITCKSQKNVENVEPLPNVGDYKPVLVTKRAKNGELFQCPMCSTTYEQKRLRNRHLMMVHTGHRSSQKFIFDLDSAKSARANLMADTVKYNASPVATVSTTTCTPVSCTSSTVTTAGNSSEKFDRHMPPSLSSPPSLPKLDPALLPPPLLPAHVEMPAPSRKAAAARQSPPALTIASPIAHNWPKTPPSSPAVAATAPVAVSAKAAAAATTTIATATAIPTTKSNGAATGTPAAANVNGSTVASAPGSGVAASVTTPQPMPTGKRCRKKMSRKEMNIPAHVIKAKAEEALRELTGNKYYANLKF